LIRGGAGGQPSQFQWRDGEVHSDDFGRFAFGGGLVATRQRIISLADVRAPTLDWDGLYKAEGKKSSVSMEHTPMLNEDFESTSVLRLIVLHTASDLWQWYQHSMVCPHSFQVSNESAVFVWFADAL
jgi:hypothetical protein